MLNSPRWFIKKDSEQSRTRASCQVQSHQEVGTNSSQSIVCLVGTI